MINRTNYSNLRLILFFLLIASCTINRNLRIHSPQQQSAHRRQNSTGNYISGICSYYGQKFHGRKTANGEIYDMYKLTAAHKTLPFGTLLKITNLQNQKIVVVRINDRGPYVRGRSLDLSYAAAKKLAMLKTGTAEFTAEIIYLPDKNNLK